MYLFLIKSLAPPILSQHRVNIITHLRRELKNTHRISGYCLGHRLYQHLPSRLRDCFFLPPHHPFCYPLLQIFKSVHLRFSPNHREAKVFFTICHNLCIKQILNFLLNTWGSVLAKENCGFLFVDCLFGCLLILCKDFKELLTCSSLSLTKQQVIICKEEVGDTNTISATLNAF